MASILSCCMYGLYRKDQKGPKQEQSHGWIFTVSHVKVFMAANPVLFWSRRFNAIRTEDFNVFLEKACPYKRRLGLELSGLHRKFSESAAFENADRMWTCQTVRYAEKTHVGQPMTALRMKLDAKGSTGSPTATHILEALRKAQVPLVVHNGLSLALKMRAARIGFHFQL